VLVQTRHGHGGWRTVVRTRTGPKGRFSTAWRTHSIGQYALRAKVAGGGPTRRARRDVTVYKASAASWYGPGFYGNRTACGRRLSSGTLGVANKTLPCGTKVALYYRGHAVTVPVIDRGPYVAGREYDLTGATKRRLHFGSTGTVWSAPRTR
jgi:rare lipoprotein A (peptidoglycan hydrolase)